ncbi:unnamed protein product [Bemisia tabaci]|uniref:AAA-ATPase-like domain-containing protein n=1 Tax=Bemisia tabaci TaxID=7038 RepID=A0A9P0AAK5_BEMTA|nr:unnamed protein product [Bemisia tabaci]
MCVECCRPCRRRLCSCAPSKTFVDKTNFIGLFLDMPHSTIHISVPPKFGKSVNLDMLRLYFESEDSALEEEFTDPLFHGTTFYGNPLFWDHYRQYVVLHVDFSPFKIVEDVETFNRTLAEVVCQMHDRYRSHFNFSYVDCKKTPAQALVDHYNEYKLSIFDAGKHLIKAISWRFALEVIVLIDNVDAILHNYMIGPGRDKEKIHNYFGQFLRD